MQKLKVSNLSDIEAIEKIPIEERLPYFNSYDLLKYGTAINPDAKAISFIASGEDYLNPIEITYRRFLYRVTQTANLFHNLGIGYNDVITIIMPNCLEYYYMFWGGEAAGIVNPINYMLEASSMLNLCTSAKTKILVVPGEDTDAVGKDIWKKVMTIRKDLPELKAIIRVKGTSDEKNGIYGYEDIITKFQGDNLDSGRTINPQDTSSMLYTGGTTGTPKLAVRSHFNEACIPFIMNMIDGSLSPGESLLAITPLFHTLGQVGGGTLAFSAGGRAVVLTPYGFRDTAIVKNIYRIIEHYHAVDIFLVPTIVFAMLDIPVDGADISSFRRVSCGGAPMSKEIVERWESKTNAKIWQGYGLTEGTAMTSGDPANGERRIGSIGLRLPYMLHKIFLLDEKGNFIEEAKTGEIGTVCIKGPTVMKRYMDSDHNAKVWPKEGWLNTGDMGRQDADGYIWLTGRSKELIRRSGHNIDPAVIESPVYKLDGVLVAAAVAKPDPYAGEVACLYVQLKEGYNLTQETIMAYLQEHIGEKAAIPKEIVIIDNMPITTVGKIFKPALRWDAIRRVYETALSALKDQVQSCKVDVGEDKALGILANVIVKPNVETEVDYIEKRVKDILAPFSIPYRIQII
jgi:fatty-acyl-CoA synthase